ncbi:protein C19orf12 homolog [Callorhinchus milii]|uniref:Chromosome 19 open reading frame 12 n=1 Tax=Callorhinchus milii TaxID=7868 RepID=A0A4W3J632_CALMI|nr:protein C19orf12 homolog [Callorhinchus milii]XP_042196434.1 protein C19orf12 homolog [Callorhinchus milii]|eukprot:gi/632944585/ref/XP_007887586.1/ PREDICTED: protein C19orf12 homolog [Callorhinchus milii]
MPVDVNEILHLVCHISKVKKIHVAVKSSGKGAIVAGACAFFGGLLGGPFGIAAGGAVGGLVGAWMTSGQFKPLPQILMELPPNQQRMLSAEVHKIIKHLDWTDAVHLVALVMRNPSLTQLVLQTALNFFSQQFDAQIKYED